MYNDILFKEMNTDNNDYTSGTSIFMLNYEQYLVVITGNVLKFRNR